ncbi:MAG TPA: hypothetical protein VK790_13880 [Solirubrobacteraceae bacterium]|jgi:hypothetical protein|nr:hypothetical protein [Solirubrobacteraceae bacterium]
MRRLRLLICACVLAIGISAAGAGAALASTFYVNGASGNDANPCTEPATPCKTIGAAITKSESALGDATIEVAAGIYKEAVDLSSPADGGITINGAGSGPVGTQIVGLKKVSAGTIDVGQPESSATLSNLQVVVPNEENTGPAIQAEGGLLLENVIIDMRDPSSADGIQLEELGSLTMDGSSVYMESGTTGTAIASFGTPSSLDESTIPGRSLSPSIRTVELTIEKKARRESSSSWRRRRASTACASR